MMFRHSSSLGGVGIMAFFLQQRFNIRAGTFQLAVDSTILLCALFFIAWHLVLISILAAFCLNMVISLNHRPERYFPVQGENNTKKVEGERTEPKLGSGLDNNLNSELRAQNG